MGGEVGDRLRRAKARRGEGVGVSAEGRGRVAHSCARLFGRTLATSPGSTALPFMVWDLPAPLCP